MPKISIQKLEEAKRAMKAAGYEITGWSRARGHNYWTVVRVLRGERGIVKGGEKSQAIIRDLIKEGFLRTSHKQQVAA